MASTLTVQIEHYRQRLQNSQLGQFFRWWGGELRGMLPASWRAKLLPPKRAVVLRLSGSELSVELQEADQRQQLAVLPLAEDFKLHEQRLHDVLAERELLQSPRELLIEDSMVLRKEVTLPLAAESNLSQALGYEMDRQTPFRADDVYFDFRIIERNRDTAQLRVELLLTPRLELDRQIEVLVHRGLQPSAVDVEVDGRAVGINFLPPDQRHRALNWRVRVNWSLAGVLLLLVAAVMFQSLWLRKQQIESVKLAIEEVRSEAMRVQQIRQQIEDAYEAAGFLTGRRASAVPTVKVLAEVTRVLPDDTFLDRLVIDEESVQMQGKSNNAQRLIELVNQSGYFSNAAFRGPTRLDTRTQKEIFDLTANTATEGED